MTHPDDHVELRVLPLGGTLCRQVLIINALLLLLSGCTDLLPRQPKKNGVSEFQDKGLKKAEEDYAVAKARRFFEEEGADMLAEVQSSSPAFLPGERNPFAEAAVLKAQAEEELALRRLFEVQRQVARPPRYIGLIHGAMSPLSLIIRSAFTCVPHKCRFYAFPNDGMVYDLTFLVGMITVMGALSLLVGGIAGSMTAVVYRRLSHIRRFFNR